jgi:hypothetical protein
MAFTDFKSISEVQQEFHIKFSEGSFVHIKECNHSRIVNLLMVFGL